jgi:hypothetical protein
LNLPMTLLTAPVMAVQAIRPIRLVLVQALNSVNINRLLKSPRKRAFFWLKFPV